jgi:hypothetical protein
MLRARSRRFRSAKVVLTAAVALIAFGVLPATSAWAVGPPVNTVKPLALGTPEVGKTFNVTKGTWTESPTTYTFQWERCSATGTECKVIAGATSQSYVPVESDRRHTLVAQVTAANSAGEGTASTNPTKEVGPLNVPEFVSFEHRYPVPFRFSTSSANFSWQGGEVRCSEMSGSGTISGPISVTGAHLLLTGCRVERYECQKVFESTALKGRFVYTNEATKKVGLLLQPEGESWGTIRCQGGLATIRGSVVAEISPVNFLTHEFTLSFSREGLNQLEWNQNGFYTPWRLEGINAFNTSERGEIVG